jgi:hypothetical protein
MGNFRERTPKMGSFLLDRTNRFLIGDSNGANSMGRL